MDSKQDWLVLKRPDQTFVHVIPRNDLEPHDETEACRCEPELKEGEGPQNSLLVHQAYDGRVE